MSGRHGTGDLAATCDVEQPVQPPLVFAREETRAESGIRSVA